VPLSLTISHYAGSYRVVGQAERRRYRPRPATPCHGAAEWVPGEWLGDSVMSEAAAHRHNEARCDIEAAFEELEDHHPNRFLIVLFSSLSLSLSHLTFAQIHMLSLASRFSMQLPNLDSRNSFSTTPHRCDFPNVDVFPCFSRREILTHRSPLDLHCPFRPSFASYPASTCSSFFADHDLHVPPLTQAHLPLLRARKTISPRHTCPSPRCRVF
jgi:hypothetical protein